MKDEIKREDWAEYFKGFSKHNQGRLTKLEVLGELGVQPEERHLPFAGISIEEAGEGAPRVEIMLGGETAGAYHLTHTITRVSRLLQKLGGDGRDEAIEFEDASGAKTILLFEAPAGLKASS